MYIIKLKRSEQKVVVKHYTNKFNLQHVGRRGLQGETGPQGPKGDQGPQGIQGIQGVKGDDGYTPIKGVDYFDGEDGADGAQGIPGVKGDTGEQGIQGIQGDKGDTGPVGPTGPQGATGATGPQGPAGNPTAFELRGTGFPEGVVTASVGTYYTDTAGTNGAIRWVKATGTGTTGWKVVYGDTGWRNVNTLINAYFTIGTGGFVYYRRIGPVVYVKANDIAVNVDNQVAQLPSIAGFKDPFPTEYGVVNYPIGQTFRCISYTGGSLTFVRPPKDLLLRHSESFTTTDAWPTTLPGTPA